MVLAEFLTTSIVMRRESVTEELLDYCTQCLFESAVSEGQTVDAQGARTRKVGATSNLLEGRSNIIAHNSKVEP